MLVGGFTASDWLFTKLYELLPSFVLKTSCECSSKSNCTTINKKLLQKQSCFGWRNLILSLPLREHSRFRIHVSFIHIAYDPSNSDTNMGLKTRSPLPLGLGGSVGLSVLSYPKWVACSLSSKAWVSYSICRTPKFRKRRNWDDHITGLQIVRLIYEFLLFLFGVIVETSWIQCEQTFIPVNVLSQSFIWRPFPSRFPRTGKLCCSISLSFNSQQPYRDHQLELIRYHRLQLP